MPGRTTLRIASLSLLVLSGALLAAGASEESPLPELSRAVDIQSADAPPFTLEADITLQIKVPERGHYTWKWADRNLWSQEATLDDFHQILIRKDDNLYTSRDSAYTPLRVSELQDLLWVLRNEGRLWKTKKIRDESENGAPRRCIELRRSQGGRWNPERLVCFDPATMNVVSDEMRYANEYRRKEYSDYQEFGQHRYPRRLTLFVNGSPVVKVENVTLRQESFPEDAFNPPPESIVRRRCEGMRWPVGVKTPNPRYPKSASQNRLAGTAVLAVTVLPDGSVGTINVIQSAGRTMDAAAQEAVQNWKFKPAMCGTEAVTADIRVELNFNLR
jgi:TonB family protein